MKSVVQSEGLATPNPQPVKGPPTGTQASIIKPGVGDAPRKHKKKRAPKQEACEEKALVPYVPKEVVVNIVEDVTDVKHRDLECVEPSSSQSRFRQSIRWIVNTTSGGSIDKTVQKVLMHAPITISVSGLKESNPNDWADVARELINDEVGNVPDEFLTSETKWKLWRKRCGLWKFIMRFYTFIVYFLGCCTTWDKPYAFSVVEDTCFGFRTTPKYRGRFKRTPRPECKPRRYNIGFTIAPHHLAISRTCSCNEELALLSRQMLPPLGTDVSRKAAWHRGLNYLMLYKSLFKTGAYNDVKGKEAYFKHLKPKQRAIYEQAMAALECIDYINPNTKAFVKREWLLACKGFHQIDPRLISGKWGPYTALTGPFYYWWSKQVSFNLWKDVKKAYTMPFVCTAGMNGVEIGSLISMYECDGWIPYEGDFSRYDGRTEIEALDAECKFYEALEFDATTLKLLKLQRVTSGKTQQGHEFTCHGKFSSGVNNTTYGNTLRSIMILGAVCLEMGLRVEDFRIVVLGDDNILFTRRPIDVAEFKLRCIAYGHKLDMKATNYDLLEFCNMRFWDVGHTRVLAPKPFRTLAKSFSPSDASVESDNDIAAHVQGVARGYKIVEWVPILGKVCNAVLQGRAAIDKTKRNKPSENPNKMQWTDVSDIDLECLDRQFYTIYGHYIEDVENILSVCDFTKVGWAYTHPILDHCLKIDCGQWEPVPYRYADRVLDDRRSKIGIWVGGRVMLLWHSLKRGCGALWVKITPKRPSRRV